MALQSPLLRHLRPRPRDPDDVVPKLRYQPCRRSLSTGQAFRVNTPGAVGGASVVRLVDMQNQFTAIVEQDGLGFPEPTGKAKPGKPVSKTSATPLR